MAVTELLGFIFNVWVLLSAVALVVLKQSVRFVPQNTALVVERFGKYRTTMEAGLNFLVPFIDRVAYNQTLKEQAVVVSTKRAATCRFQSRKQSCSKYSSEIVVKCSRGLSSMLKNGIPSWNPS